MEEEMKPNQKPPGSLVAVLRLPTLVDSHAMGRVVWHRDQNPLCDLEKIYLGQSYITPAWSSFVRATEKVALLQCEDGVYVLIGPVRDRRNERNSDESE
jgi:hypothetical protein